MKLKTAFVPRKPAAMAGVDGAMDKNPAIETALAPRSETLIR